MGSFDEGENPGGLQLFSFRKDEAIYREGDAVVRWYLIASGAARTCRTHGDGHRQLIGFHYPGDFFGIEQGVHIERAEALSELRCWGFAQACGDAAAAEHGVPPPLQAALLSARRAVHLYGRRSAPERLATFIVSTASRLDAEREFDLPMSANDIADHLGVAIHTLQRSFMLLRDQGLVALDDERRLAILDQDRLEALAGDAA